MMPHMLVLSSNPYGGPCAALSRLRCGGFHPPALLIFFRPTRLNHLPGPAQRQRLGRDIFRHDRSRPDDRPLADADRGDQRNIAADKYVIADHGLMFVHSVIVARNRAGPDVHTFADLGVAKITQMIGFRSYAKLRFLQFHEVPDSRRTSEDRSRSE